MDSDLEPSLSAPGLSVTPARQDPGDPEPSTDPQQVPASAAASAAIAAAMTVKVTRGHSCVLCQQRKVRCDRAKPCSNCVRAKAECRVVPPQPPRRRAAAKKRQVLLGERELIERLRRYEALLAEKGVEVDAIANDVRVLPDDGGRDRESGRRRDEVAELEDEMVGLKTSASAVGDAPEGSVDSARRPFKWFPANKEFKTSEDPLHNSSEEEEFDGSTIHNAYDKVFSNQDGFPIMLGGAVASVTDAHPNPVQIFQLWQIYISNINPLLKISHIPTLQAQIVAASADLAHVAPELEAFMFAMYLLSTVSLDEEQVRASFNEDKTSMIARFNAACQQALINAGFMRSNSIMVLQAFLLYLIAVRQYIDPRVLFCLNGIGVRIAQRLGLHRDAAPFGVSPFEVEMRRRLWWQLVIFDRRLGEVTGSTITALKSTPSDCRLPLNINDADLFVGATEPPTPSNGPSEMIFALTRLELGRMVGPDIVPTPLPTAAAPPKNQPPKAHYMHNKAPQRGSESTPNPDTIRMSATFNFEPKIGEGIAATAKHLDETYLRSLDPKIPLHLFTLNMARSSLAKMRVIQYLCSGVPPSRQQAKDDPSAAVAATGPPTPPNQSASPSPATATRFSSYVLQRAATLTPAERESLVLDSIEMIEADNELHSTPSVKGFMWYAHMYFPFPAYMFLVHELRRTPTGPLADRAWRALVVSHEQRRAADMMAGGAGKGTGHAADATVGKFLRSAMHVALGAMFVKAWDAREAAETARLGPGRGPEAPRFITLLRRRLAELSRGGPAVPPDERNPFRQRLASLIPDVMGKASKSMAATAPGDVVVNNTTPVPGSAKADMFRIVSRTGRLAADDDGGDGDGHLTSSAALSVAGSLTPASSFVPPPLSEAGSTTITNNNSGASSIATPSSALAEGLAAPTESAAGSFNAGYHSMPNPAPAGVDASNDNLSPLNRFFASGSGNGSGMLFGASAMMPSVDFGDMEMDWSQFVQGYADGTAAAGFGWSDFAGVGGDDVIMNGSDWFGSGIP